MKLQEITIANLASMICGDKEHKFAKNFPYRSSSSLTNFFLNCELHYEHDGTTRKAWVTNCNVSPEVAQVVS